MEPTELDRACDLARKIAKSKTKGRHYRDDVIGDALLAVAQGVTDRAGLELACRNSERREWAYSKPLIPLDEWTETAEIEAPARAQVNLWEAIKALPERQYEAVVLIYWGGLSQAGAAVCMKCDQSTVSRLIGDAIKQIKSFLENGA